MTRVPMGSPSTLPLQHGIGIGPLLAADPGEVRRADVQPVHRRRDDRREIRLQTREQLDAFALDSHRKRGARRPRRARSRTRSCRVEIDAAGRQRGLHDVDEGIRYDATLEGIGAVKLLKEGGAITAANASQICDGVGGGAGRQRARR